MNYFIPNDINCRLKKKHLFVLVRPFFSDKGWIQQGNKFDEWGLNSEDHRLVENIEIADILIIPFPINYYHEKHKISLLNNYSHLCKKYKIKGFGFIGGDYGVEYPDLEHVTYFRMGGFKSKLSKNNIGFPAALSDYYLNLYKSNKIKIRPKSGMPKIGFCGHATSNILVRLYQILKYFKENLYRFFKNPKRFDYEPYFQSAYERYRLLKIFDEAKDIETEFIAHSRYRGGARSNSDREKSTEEYFNNITNSDYVLCLRGAGNFSIRFYETLMMGRIPVFINTDCILPFENKIDWKNHVVWIEWKDRHRIKEILKNFHSELSKHDFERLQLNNRQLWLNFLQPKQIFKRLKNL